MQTSTIRPGLIVSLKTSIEGNVNYERYDVEPDHLTEEGQKRAVWETKRTIVDPEEHDAAVIVRSKCRSLIVGVCSISTFGLLCPESRKEQLDLAIAEAQNWATVFNSQAKLTRIRVYVITGRVAQDDVEAVRAINSEVRDLMETMETGLQNLDVRVVRDAANKAKSIGQMLSDEASERIKVAVDAARELARKIVKAGEAGAEAIDHAAIRKIAEARTAFLDMDSLSEAEIATPEQSARAIDLEPESVEVEYAKAEAKAAALEMEE
jgi:hypothetical protein